MACHAIYAPMLMGGINTQSLHIYTPKPIIPYDKDYDIKLNVIQSLHSLISERIINTYPQ